MQGRTRRALAALAATAGDAAAGKPNAADPGSANSGGGDTYVMPMDAEGGEWKVAALSGSALP